MAPSEWASQRKAKGCDIVHSDSHMLLRVHRQAVQSGSVRCTVLSVCHCVHETDKAARRDKTLVWGIGEKGQKAAGLARESQGLSLTPKPLNAKNRNRKTTNIYRFFLKIVLTRNESAPPKNSPIKSRLCSAYDVGFFFRRSTL